MKKMIEIFITLLLTTQLINANFDCAGFKGYQTGLNEASLESTKSVELLCNTEKSEEGKFTLLEVKKNNRVIIESRLYIEEVKEKTPEDEENNDYEEIKLDCFEVKSIFSSTSYNHFQCSPAPEPQKDDTGKELPLKPDEVYFEIMTQLEEQIDYINEKMNENSEISFNDIYNFLKAFESEGKGLLQLQEFKQLQIDNSFQTKEVEGEGQTFKIEGQDGIHFWFKFQNLPLVLLKCTIYSASDHYLRMIITTNKQEFDIYISKYITENMEAQDGEDESMYDENPLGNKEKYKFLAVKYSSQIAGILQELAGVKVEGKGLISPELLSKPETEQVQVPEQKPGLAHYQKTELMSTPIAIMMIHDMINTVEDKQEHNLLSKTQLDYQFLPDIHPDGEHNLETMNTLNWFLFEDTHYTKEQLVSLGALYEDLEIDEVREDRLKNDGKEEADPNSPIDIPIQAGDVIEQINEYLQKYHQNHYNYFQFTVGLKQIIRKFVIKLYGYEDEFYKSVQIKFLTQYFAAEHIIPLSDYNSFYHEVNKKFKEAIDHYQDYVLELEKVSIHQTEIGVDDFKMYLDEFLDPAQFCIEDKADKGFEVKQIIQGLAKPTFDDAKADCANDAYSDMSEPKPVDEMQLKPCADVAQGKARTVFKLETGKGEHGKSIFVLNIQEPQIQNKAKSSSTLLQFFKVYQYNYKPMLKRQIRSQVCHLITGKYARSQIDEKERHDAFTGGLTDQNNRRK